MEKSSNVINEIQIARDKVLVSWEIKFIEAENDTLKPQVVVSFSHERAATNMKNQGEHASAHALGVMLVMQILRDFIPTEITNYAGVTKLADELRLVESRDDFFLNHFKIAHTRPKLLGGLSEEVSAQRIVADDALDALRKAIDVAEGYSMLAPNKLQPATKEAVVILNELSGADAKPLSESQKTAIKGAVTVLEGLAGIKASLLAGQKLAIRRDHSTRVSTLAAIRLLEYLNKALFTTFKRTKKEEDADAEYEKSEGARVRAALAYLQEVTVSPVELVVSAQVAQADAEAVRNLPPRAAKTKAAVAALDTKLGEEQGQIVDAICDLLHYPPIANIVIEPYSDTPVNIANPIERTNNLNVLGFVLARHIAMVFATFERLNRRADKQKIIDAFIERKLDEWNPPFMARKKIVTNINNGLGDWDKKGRFNARQDIEDERHVALALDQSVLSLEQSPAKGASLAEAMGVEEEEEDISHQQGILFSSASKSASQPQKLPIVLQSQSSSQEEKKPSSSSATLDYKS